MRLRFDTAAPIDLGLTVVLAIAALVAQLSDVPAWAGVPLGVLVVLLAPGYALLSAALPSRAAVERRGVTHRPLGPLAWMAVSMALSLAVVSLLGLAWNATPAGLSRGAILGSIAVLTTLASAVAFVRRAQVPPEHQMRLRMDWQPLPGRERHDLVLGVLLAVSAVLIVGAVAFVAVGPRDEHRFTEVYLLGPDGQAACLPVGYSGGRFLPPPREECGPVGNVSLGIVNHEGRATHYWARMVWTNESLGPAGPVVDAIEWQTLEADLPHVPVDLRLGQNFTPQHEVALTLPPPPGQGTWRLSFQVYLQPPPPVEATRSFLATPDYRTHLWILAGDG